MFVYAPIPPGAYPLNDFPNYRSSAKRAPKLAPVTIPQTVSETLGPRYGAEMGGRHARDMTRAVAGGVALGQRIIVRGQVRDEHGQPERNALIELWQANAAGRYRHDGDQHDAALDPFFTGAGNVVTNDDGRYEFTTIEPGAYPWGNHHNAWRPKHIHFSLFGQAWATRLITQMYFPGDPTLPFDPIFNSIENPTARARLVAKCDIEQSLPNFALAYSFDIVLRGPRATPSSITR